MPSSLAPRSDAPEAQAAVERALADLRRGVPVVLCDDASAGALLVQALEGLGEADLARFARLAGTQISLLLTARRAAALGFRPPGGHQGTGIVALPVDDRRAGDLVALADVTGGRPAHLSGDAAARAEPAEAAEAAIQLVKLARLLPAVIAAPLREGGEEAARTWARKHALLAVDAPAVAGYRRLTDGNLREVAAAQVPLAGAENARVVAFRPADGGQEHLAVVIGEPREGEPVLVRLHSECLTGDLLGSLRCDCGDQLRGAIDAIGKEGAGVLLYLSQEGRGIGLVNKLRAYELQDRGMDTAEANEQLGFEPDERVYVPAAEMLRHLGFRRVRLLTNNPQKVAALEACGIEVAERVAHRFPSNRHNEPYLSAKQRHFGHIF
ncbi:MAG: GTP cyclohydrolase II [Rhodovibrionaceae bacterium]|nr:GTP cyclohydrolase II [Rhodovibrionaceae bacterium]